MSMLRDFQKITAIDCAVGHGRGDQDPNLNLPAEVRRAVADSSLIVKARFDSDWRRLAAHRRACLAADASYRPYRLRARTRRAELPTRDGEARKDLWVGWSRLHDTAR